MSTYVMFLRGINVGGVRVPMPRLREVLTEAGAREVTTWLATGNVRLAFDGPADDLKTLAERVLSDEFGYDAYVLVRDADELANILDAWPFTPDHAHHRYVVLGGAPAYDDAQAAIDANPSDEHVLAAGDDLYWRTLKGATTTSPVAKVLARPRWKSTTTTRNLNTLEKMLA
ncbi:DUF1697 domain-containing protein [Dermacoccus sp. CCH2-D9]|uniref:DUF1697 domain-containing protein n=1 Tax=Dermacoccus sp. CCH2-D9 TaxID=1768779 RepID=UPI0007816DFE|nr:DUF1697 domain-containing protein [Dermacoccus sp. CCH2-D9]